MISYCRANLWVTKSEIFILPIFGQKVQYQSMKAVSTNKNHTTLTSSAHEYAWKKDLSCPAIYIKINVWPFKKYVYFLPGLHLRMRAIRWDRWKQAYNKAIYLWCSHCISLTKPCLMSHHTSYAFLSLSVYKQWRKFSVCSVLAWL